MMLYSCLTPYTNINSKCMKHLHVKTKTMKLLEENIGVHFHDRLLRKDFLNITSKGQEVNGKKKSDFIKTKNFASKDIIKKVRRTVENICKSYI